MVKLDYYDGVKLDLFGRKLHAYIVFVCSAAVAAARQL
jgi:hypothetical protein